MNDTTTTGHEFAQDSREAQHVAEPDPAFTADRGQRAPGLLTAKSCVALAGQPTNLADLLGMTDGTDIDFDPPRSRDLARAADFG